MKGLLIVSGLGLLAMLAEIFKFRKALLPLVLTGLAIAFGINLMEWNHEASMGYLTNMTRFDRPALAFSGIILLTAFLWFILANAYFRTDSHMVDVFALVLFALVGALMLTSFTNMTTLFLGIEIMSIPLYVLAASKKNDVSSNEAGFKYLIMGSFASAFLLFGIALIYGATGSFDLQTIQEYTQDTAEPPLFFYAGIMMMLVAMCFKVSAAPFHFWAPDVYQGSPTMVTALMSTVVKTAAFAAFLRLFLVAFGNTGETWTTVLAVVTALSLIVANFSAALQSNVKRMLAYSSISHAAFMLMVLVANIRTNMSLDAILYYALAYSAGSIAAFGVLYHVSRQGDENFTAFDGLGKRNPGLALCMTVAMLSLAGIPITAGFFAKYFVFTSVIGTNYQWLLYLAVVTSAVGVYYYLKVIIAMYFRSSNNDAPVAVDGAGNFVIVFTTLITLIIGIAPELLAGMFRF